MKVNVTVSKSQVKPTSTVFISLSGGGTGSNRITVNEVETLESLGVSLNEQASKPEFPTAQIAEISTSNLSDEQKSAKTTAALAEYQKAVNEYSAQGGTTIQDRLVFAVMDYLVKNHGFSKTDQAGKAYIKPGELQVAATPNGSTGELVFSVTGTSVWG